MSIDSIFSAQQENTYVQAATTAAERVEKLKALQAELIKRKPDICKAANAELGSCDMDADAQLVMLKTEIEFITKNLAKWMKPKKVKNSMATMGKKCYIQYEAKGQVLNLSTWNAPIAINLIPAIGALCSGNTAIIKPSELAPHTAKVTDEIVSAVYQQNECAVIEGEADVAQALLAKPFNHIYYTGGHHVGRIVMRAAAENFAGITLEMGGKNPVIIDESADIDNAAQKLAWGRMANAGQVCIAPEYVAIHNSVKDEFITALKKYIEEMYNSRGTGVQTSEEFPRIVNDNHFQRVKGLIDDAVAKGAKVEYGGGSDASDKYIEPTVLTNVSEEMELMKGEIFGPVLSIIGCDSREELLQTTRRTEKPLAFYIFAKDREAIDYFLQGSTAGSTVVNHNLIQSGTNPNLPFGGVNHSGIGRIGGHQSFLEFSNARSVVEAPLGFRDFNINFPPYSDRYKKIIGNMLSK